MVLTRPARPSSRRNHHSREHPEAASHHQHHHHHAPENNSLHHLRDFQTDIDPQEEPLLSEAYSCNTLLTECEGTIDNSDAKTALIHAEVSTAKQYFKLFRTPIIHLRVSEYKSHVFLTG